MHLTYNAINSQYAVKQSLPIYSWGCLNFTLRYSCFSLRSKWGDLEGFNAFNAKELDEENNMYYYSARYYAPPTFISRDPLMDEKPWLSPYHYCSNSPLNRVDPTGMNDWYPDENGNLVAEKGDNAWTLAEYLNTSPEIAINMLGEQGYSVNDKGVLNLKVGDIFEVDYGTSSSSSREDLGVLGNLIRDQAGSEFSKNMFENFWNGGGDIELTGKQFAGILLYLKKTM